MSGTPPPQPLPNATVRYPSTVYESSGFVYDLSIIAHASHLESHPVPTHASLHPLLADTISSALTGPLPYHTHHTTSHPLVTITLPPNPQPSSSMLHSFPLHYTTSPFFLFGFVGLPLFRPATPVAPLSRHSVFGSLPWQVTPPSIPTPASLPSITFHYLRALPFCQATGGTSGWGRGLQTIFFPAGFFFCNPPQIVLF